MRLVDIEKDLKKLFDNGASDLEVFKQIYELVYNFLKYKKLLNNELEYEEVASIGAEDLFYRVNRGVIITSWLGYINASYMRYINEYRKKYSPEVVNVEDNPALADAITLMSASSRLQNPLDYEKVENMKYIQSDIINTINSVLDNSIFMKYTGEYFTAKASIILSILLEDFAVYGADKTYANYIHLLYVQVKDKIIKTIGMSHYNMSDALKRFVFECLYPERDDVDE